MYKILILSTAIGALAATACAEEPRAADLKHHAEVATVNPDLLGQSKTERAAFIEDYLMSAETVSDMEEEFGVGGVKIIRRAYATKLFQPIWTRNGVADMEDTLYDVFAHGILSEDVFSGEFETLVKTRFKSKSKDEQALADVALTRVWMRLAKAISGDLSDEGHMVVKASSPVVRFNVPDTLLKNARGKDDSALMDMMPNAPQYKALKSSLKDYRAIKRAGGWLAIRDGDALELGDVDPRIPNVRTRLALEGYDAEAISLGGEENLYDANLEAALKTFQIRHGLEDDGIIGGNTLEALNESVESKIDRIAESMYRWRAQGELGERYIWANIPSFTAEGWNKGEMEIRQRTIVGKRRFATPEFSDEVEYLVANPKWFLPISIVRRQKVPKLKKDPSYAARHGYHIFDRATGERVDAFNVDWTQPGVSRQYRFVQQPGEGNALGQMKIIFPNQYSIYLHGTPGKALFDRAERAFSSGCVRLEDPVAMAEWIASNDDNAKVSTIETAMAEDERVKLDLETQVPVHITYFTVTVDDEGNTQFWRDIYDRYDGIREVQEYEKLWDAQKMARTETQNSGPVDSFR